MQTFLPYEHFEASAKCLDRQRLGKQRVEVYQILRALRGITKGWRNHPATKMWAGHEDALVEYGLWCCAEWARRGYVDNLAPKIRALASDLYEKADRSYPEWLGMDALHSSHRAALLRKDPEHYGQFGWTDDVEEYWWPTKQQVQA